MTTKNKQPQGQQQQQKQEQKQIPFGNDKQGSNSKSNGAMTPTDARALVAIDLGAESCRVSLLRWVEGVARIQLVYRFANHAVESVDGLHWNLPSILTGLDEGLERCAGVATEGVRSIAVDGWAVDYVRLGADDKPVGTTPADKERPPGTPVAAPFCYRDERTVVAEASLHERISAERMRALTGIQLLRLNTAYQMFADTAEVRGLKWLNLPEYCLYRLGARPVSERTNASHTQMLGIDGEWSEEILRELDMTAAMMPELVEPGTDVGQVRGKLAGHAAFRETRLIAPACHDTASAIAAVPDAGEDWAYISSGTWSLVGRLLRAADNSERSCAENFTNLAGAGGRICFHKNVNGMWLLRQCIESWTLEGAAIDLPELVRRASEVAAPKYGLDVDDPDLLLSGRMPQRINAQLHRRGLAELSVHAEDAPAMASFIFHSLARRYAEVLRSVAEITGEGFSKIYIMGGGSQNEFLNRLTAEATGVPVIRVGTECSTVGNFAVQLAALERGSSVSEWARRLAEA